LQLRHDVDSLKSKLKDAEAERDKYHDDRQNLCQEIMKLNHSLSETKVTLNKVLKSTFTGQLGRAKNCHRWTESVDRGAHCGE